MRRPFVNRASLACLHLRRTLVVLSRACLRSLQPFGLYTRDTTDRDLLEPIEAS